MIPKIIKAAQWSLPIFFSGVALVYSFSRFGNTTYWDGAIGNLFATILGIITGVPVALYLERKRAMSEQEKSQSEISKRRSIVMQLLRTELTDNKARIIIRSTLPDTIPIEPLKLSHWQAILATGDLKFINDPIIITSISDAYRLLEVLVEIERDINHAAHNNTVTYVDGETAMFKLVKNSKNFHIQTMEAIDNAIIKINKVIDNKPHQDK